MYFSAAGYLADAFWFEIKNHSRNVDLGAFQVMPDHLHGVLILGGGNDGAKPKRTKHGGADLGKARFQNQGSNTVSSIIGSYKSAVTRHTRALGFDFAWQTRFYDRIIHDERAFRQIERYIIDNPKNWRGS